MKVVISSQSNQLLQEDAFIAKLSGVMSGMAGVSQLQFIESFILKQKYTINHHNIEDHSITFKPDQISEPGTLFLTWAMQACIFPEDFFKVQLKNVTEDNKRFTRLNAPFLAPPPTHVHLAHLNLSDKILKMLEDIWNAFVLLDKATMLQESEKLVRPYLATPLKDLYGFVHSCSTSTFVDFAIKTNMDRSSTIVGDFGSGSPILGIQLSVLAKATVCVDLQIVMRQIFQILELIIREDQKKKDLLSGIHLVSQDILTMTIDNLPPICKDLTHLICFIGLPDGKHFFLFSPFSLLLLSDNCFDQVCLDTFPEDEVYLFEGSRGARDFSPCCLGRIRISSPH
jgi:hypothetical protein